MTEDAKFLKRKIHGGTIDVHPTEKALVVHYETEATIIGEGGIAMIGDRKDSQKIIRVKNLNEDTDIPELARKIVESCRLLSEEQLSEIEHLLRYLLKRKKSVKKKAKQPVNSDKLADPGAFDSAEIDEVAQLTELDEYLELLYEDITEKLRASALVLQLARNPDNLEELFQNETLVGALARVLREDWKESIDLATNITYIFFCFSSFSNFHGVITHFKIGALTMKIVEHEIQNYENMMKDLGAKKRLLEESQKSGDSATSIAAQMSYESSLSKLNTLKRKQEQLFRVSFYMLLNISEDLTVEVKMHNKGIVTLLSRCLDRDNFELLILLVSFLKKLSIFRENKDEMLKNHTIEKLSMILERPERDLLNVTLGLLLNLSFDCTARKQMVACSMVPKLVELLESEKCDQAYVLFVLYHLSTDESTAKEFVETNCLPILIRLALEDPNKPPDVVPMALAINLANNPQCARMLSEGRGIKLLMKRAMKFGDPLIMKLLRHISQHEKEIKVKFLDFIPKLAEIVTSGFGSVKSESVESSAFCVRKRSGCSKSKAHVNIFAGALNEDGLNPSSDEMFQLECLGCLANLRVNELDFNRILIELNLLEWIKSKLVDCDQVPRQKFNSPMYNLSSSSRRKRLISDEFILEAIRLLGTASHDPSAAKLIVEEDIVPILVDVLNRKQEDDQIVCQIIYTFYQLIYHRETIRTVVHSTDVPAYLIDLMHDKNREIRKLCEIALDLISEFDCNWCSRVQAERFRWHNNQWLQMLDPTTCAATIPNEPITEAALATAFANGHKRFRRSIVSCGAPDMDEASEMMNPGPFGFGNDVDDATAFLLSISANQNGRKFSAENGGFSYHDQLEIMYPDMYNDINSFDLDGLSAAVSEGTISDSSLTPRRSISS